MVKYPQAKSTQLCCDSSEIMHLLWFVCKFLLKQNLLLTLCDINVELSPRVDKIDIFECDILIEKRMLYQSTPLWKSLPIMSGPFDIVSLVYLHTLIKNISNNHKIYLSSRALVLHLVKSVYSHKKSFSIVSNVLDIVVQNLSQFTVFFTTDRFYDYFWVFSVIHETSTFALEYSHKYLQKFDLKGLKGFP